MNKEIQSRLENQALHSIFFNEKFEFLNFTCTSIAFNCILYEGGVLYRCRHQDRMGFSASRRILTGCETWS